MAQPYADSSNEQSAGNDDNTREKAGVDSSLFVGGAKRITGNWPNFPHFGICEIDRDRHIVVHLGCTMRKNAVASTGEEDLFPISVQEVPFAGGDLTVGNPSYTYSYTGGDMTQIDMLLDGTTYRKTFGYDGDGNMTSASAWGQL